MSTLLTPNPAEYRYALYCRSDQLDISYGAREPVALYREEDVARAHGVRMWPGAFTVIDLQGEDLCANSR